MEPDGVSAPPRVFRKPRNAGPRQRVTCIALAVLFVLSHSSWAATILVDEMTCTLVDAIDAANADRSVGGCAAGSGADTVQLTTDITLEGVDNDAVYGANGLPAVVSDITVEGGGFTVERSPSAPPFRFFAVTTNGILTLKDMTLRNGLTPFDGIGGAIANEGTLELTNSTLSGNSAPGPTGFGGAISSCCDGAENVTLKNCTLSGNSAHHGAAVWSWGALDLTNSTVSGNSAGPSRGAVESFEGPVALTHSTVSGNSGYGLLIWISGLEVTSSIIADNGDGNCDGSLTDGGHNFADDGTCGAGFATITPGADFDTTLDFNGGPTRTHALLPGSVAIDAAGACGQTTDQREFPRADGACDSGAFEFGPLAVIPPAVPDGQLASPVRVARANPAGTEIDLSWNVGMCPSPGYHMIHGDLLDVAAYAIGGGECELGNTGSATGIPVPPDDLWILVLANDDAQTEGSWGQVTAGQRNGTAPSGECGFVVRDNSGTCP